MGTLGLTVAQAGIVFPGKLEQVEQEEVALSASVECFNVTTSWCNPYNYPDSVISNLIKTNSDAAKMLENDDDYDYRALSTSTPSINEAFSENICKISNDLIFPKAARNTD